MCVSAHLRTTIPFTREEYFHESQSACFIRNVAVFAVRSGPDQRILLHAGRKVLRRQLLRRELLPRRRLLPRRLLQPEEVATKLRDTSRLTERGVSHFISGRSGA